MKKILMIGAGLVAKPAIQYLLNQPGFQITIADKFIHKAKELVGNHATGKAISLDINNKLYLRNFIADSDVVVSLLPWNFHPIIAELCIELNKHLVTASYVKQEMQEFHEKAREKKLIFLNEMGVDPGLDHMAAMKIINEVKAAGGEVTDFFSYCGGLPALENNNNPLGYKFSWSPEGVMLAANNDGCYLLDGKIINIPGKDLFKHYELITIPGAGVFETYVNRDALPYVELYGIKSVKSMFRGTLRNIGSCETWDYFKKLGFLNRKSTFDFDKISPKQVVANIVKSPGINVIKDVAYYLGIPAHSLILKKLEWLGLFNDKKIQIGNASIFDMFAHILQEKLVYNTGEQDLLVQYHKFIVHYSDGKKEKITSTMINTGIPGGESAMSRTVGLPVAIAAKLIAEDKINHHGVIIPIYKEIYDPLLAELKTMNIKFEEKKIWV
ncbi:saccharopine dehydrogenase NADP-binding domain-containing protein [bacterium]|nr:saccharopine dehydrogenase NADP-binding domain-containing protein [bacterium]